jgi:hypothetical protein
MHKFFLGLGFLASLVGNSLLLFLFAAFGGGADVNSWMSSSRGHFFAWMIAISVFLLVVSAIHFFLKGRHSIAIRIPFLMWPLVIGIMLLRERLG